jgi:cytochrome c553
MRRTALGLTLLLLTAAFPITLRGESGPADKVGVDFFEKKVRPILVENCYTCHSADTNAKGGLRVDDRNGLIQGGSSGPAIVLGDSENSLLIQAVRQSDENLKMPPKKKLSAEQIADLARWIEDGAAWPAAALPSALGKSSAKYEALRRNHWAWQPLRRSEAPRAQVESWGRDRLDRYILAKLDAAGLEPAGDADKRSLIRRATFDLTGLPPSPEAIAAFAADPSAAAFEKVVDALLATPSYGERWARHWLDVARYGESTGSSRNVPFPHAWRYRDYVIDAFTNDKPYDQFIREQIAGDLLPAESQRERDEHRIATGFLALGVKDVNQRFKVRFVMDNVDEQIDTVSRSILGLTASCARCHDHKFDPIPTADYYALAGIFRSTDLCAGVRNKMGGGGLDYYDTEMLLPLGPEPPPDPEAAETIAHAKAAYEVAKKEFEAIRGTPEGLSLAANGRPKQQPFRLKMVRLQNELAALTDPAVRGGVALGVRDGNAVADTEIRIRGEAEKLGPIVPRGFLSLLQVPGQPKVNFQQSGRLELAQWLTSGANPLTPRVMVNRVWQHLFGQGLVKSVDNFGSTGEAPSHPELLDDLAAQFVEDGWSVKELIRRIVLSRTYGLSSESRRSALAVDPENRLVWRHAPRRLDAEEIRDATLSVAGALDLSRPHASAAKDLKVIELPNNGPLAKRLGDQARASAHRGIYLPLLRGITPTSLDVFDFASQGMVTGSRDSTTVAPQALYLLNDPFVRRQALRMAQRLLERPELDDDARVDLAYRLSVGRSATPREIDRAIRFVADYEASHREVIAASERERDLKAVASIIADDGKSSSSGLATSSTMQVAEASTGAPAKAGAKTTGGGKPKTTTSTPPPPVNPDEIIQVEEPVNEEVVAAPNSRVAAWASFTQALLGSAEFRYVQ